jgi:Tfp pilus assembly protein FimT
MRRNGSRGRRGTGSGFSLVDLLATCAVIATVSAIAVPAITNSLEGQRLGIEARNVERELQVARLSAVQSNQPIRVRFNCPATGQYKRVELLGTVNTPAADDADTQAAARCNYPFPSTDKDAMTRPNNDGAIRTLDRKVTFSQVQTLEFWPNGTVHVTSASKPWPLIGATPVTLKLTKGTSTKSITVNSLGKIQLQ